MLYSSVAKTKHLRRKGCIADFLMPAALTPGSLSFCQQNLNRNVSDLNPSILPYYSIIPLRTHMQGKQQFQRLAFLDQAEVSRQTSEINT